MTLGLGTSLFLRMYEILHYICISVDSRACQNDDLTLECPAGQVLKIHRARYGRNSNDICTKYANGNDRPSSQLNMCSGSETTLEKVRGSCEGKASCTIKASSSVFGDRCVGTFKYLKVVHSCE